MTTDRTEEHPAPGPYAGGPTPDVLAAFEEPSGRKAPWLLVGGAGALVLALVGGVTYGVGRLSGGGAQPEDALPAGAFGFVKVDLDPSAGQKIDGFRFMRKFPALRERVALDADLREVLFDAVADEAGWDDVEFDTDVAPWMGKRAAVALYPPARGADEFPQPTPVVALQVTDAAAAEAGLRKLADGDAGAPGFVVRGDYALLAETERIAADLADKAESTPLTGDDHFAADLGAVEDGIAEAWVDLGAASRALGPSALDVGWFGGLPTRATGGTGRSIFVARFDGPDVFEVTGEVVGAETTGWSSHPVEGFADLPASSVVAVGVADGKSLVPKAYEAMRESFGAEEGGGMSFDDMVAEAETEMGIDIPDDLAVLFGDNLLAALDGSDSETVEVGARVRTDADRAERVLDALQAVAGDDWTLSRERAGDDLVVAWTPRQADRLAEDGTLGDVEAFRSALPDVADSDLAVWVDVRGLWKVLFAGWAGDEVDENLEPIDGVGVSMTSRDEGGASYRFRLVAH